MLALLAQCANVVVPEASSEAMSYYQSGMVLWAAWQFWSLFLPSLFLATGFSARLARSSEKAGRSWYGGIAMYLAIFVVLYQVLNLPLDFYASYLRPHSYGLSTESLGAWGGRYAKELLLLLISALAFVWMFYLLLRKSPKRWWFYSSCLGALIGFFLMIVQPIWIDPLFNDFGPMKNKELEQQILDLAAKAGVQGSHVFEVNKSEQTKTLNAYVVGFGGTKRIVLWDTLFPKMTPDQILFVVGHEMGHYVLNHMWWGFVYFSALFFVMFYLASRVAPYLIQRFQQCFGFNELSNIASFPLLILLINAFSLLSAPLTNAFSRHLEREADRFSLEFTQNNEAAGEAFVILQQENLGNPNPGGFYTFWRASHPSLKERVDFANRYCPYRQES